MQKMQLKMVNRELLDEARRAFNPSAITPDMSRDKIMFEAGAVKVLDWLDNRIAQTHSETTISSPQHEYDLPDSQEGFLRRAMKGSQ
jgi:hypothetical protein